MKKRSKRLQNEINLFIIEMPRFCLRSYIFWLEGKTVKQIKEVLGGDKRTSAGDRAFQRAAKYLREYHDIELKTRCPYAIKPPKPSNVVPIVRVLIPQPCYPPQWFFDKGLMYQPSKNGLRSVD